MARSRGFDVLRYVLVVINAIFLVASILLIALGSYGYDQRGIVSYISSSSLPIGCIFLGIFVFLISLLGCVGALRESTVALKVYFGIVIFILACELAIGIVGLTDYRDVDSILYNSWHDAYNNNLTVLNDIQNYFNCCGFENVNDAVVPNSTVCTTLLNTNNSCKAAVSGVLSKSYQGIGGTAIAVAVVQFVAIIFSGILFTDIGRQLLQLKRQQEEAIRLSRERDFEADDEI